MIIPPAQPPMVANTVTPTTPQQNAALASASAAAQKVAQPTQTQTKRAPGAVARADAGRGGTDAGFVGHAFDNEAAAVQAQTNGPHGTPDRQRGGKLDLSV
ncbi:hypothetical protein [Niveispirillum irakense]|uniref:hypothetical protein n=1 Tax=Niveispirillum irakense TaxID=34011 RepID=UPI0003FEA232|nr:hypothetical protein [Niveispirillum irakense]